MDFLTTLTLVFALATFILGFLILFYVAIITLVEDLMHVERIKWKPLRKVWHKCFGHGRVSEVIRGTSVHRTGERHEKEMGVVYRNCSADCFRKWNYRRAPRTAERIDLLKEKESARKKL